MTGTTQGGGSSGTSTTGPKLVSRKASTFDLTAALNYHKYLSPFQVEKYTYMFHAFFDLDKNNVINQDDITSLSEKMRKFAGWSKKDETYLNILDVMKTFLDCLQDQVNAEEVANADDAVIPTWEEALGPSKKLTFDITLRQWLNMWGRLCYGSAGLKDFPCWVQLLPTVFFKVIDTDKDGVLSIFEYHRFYKDFIGIESKGLEMVTQEGFRAMTAGGDHKFTLANFSFCFSNFLLGRNIFGPGKYIFGVFDNRDLKEPFQIIYNKEDPED